MKEVKVSDECARMIEMLRDGDWFGYYRECEHILNVLSGLNELQECAEESDEVAGHSSDIQRASAMILYHYKVMKRLADEEDFKDEGKVLVTQTEC